MIDWGLSAAIVAAVAFISNMITDAKLKRLTNRLAELEKKLDSICVEGVIDDNGITDTDNA